MEKKRSWLESYLAPSKEFVGYEFYLNCKFVENSFCGIFAVIVIKDGVVVCKELHQIECSSKAVCIMEAMMFALKKCENADIITIHTEYFGNYFAFQYKATDAKKYTSVSYLSKYRELKKDTEVIFDKTTWFKRDKFDDEVEKMVEATKM